MAIIDNIESMAFLVQTQHSLMVVIHSTQQDFSQSGTAARRYVSLESNIQKVYKS